jgi:hypothetical protein
MCPSEYAFYSVGPFHRVLKGPNASPVALGRYSEEESRETGATLKDLALGSVGGTQNTVGELRPCGVTRIAPGIDQTLKQTFIGGTSVSECAKLS